MAREDEMSTRESAAALSATADQANSAQQGSSYAWTRTSNEVQGLRRHGPGPTSFVQATFPFNLAAGACGMGAAYFLQHRIPRQALGAAAFGLLFITAGQMVDRGSVIQGYNLGAATSVGLVVACAPGALKRRPAESALATIGGVSAISHTYNTASARRNPFINPLLMGPAVPKAEQE